MGEEVMVPAMNSISLPVTTLSRKVEEKEEADEEEVKAYLTCLWSFFFHR